MKLADLIKDVTILKSHGPLDRSIRALQYDSRKVEAGDVFFAWKGVSSDGHHFIPQVRSKGVAAIVLDNETFMHANGTTFLLVSDVRKAMASMAAAYYTHPDQSLPIVGITGTNGKTTTTFVLKHLLRKALGPVGLLGTVRYEIGDRILPAARTTPESLDLFQYLSQIRTAKCRSAVMEVSSHALSQHRVAPIHFQVGIFTNLTQDHLDYHGTMEEYRAAKGKLFAQLSTADGPIGKPSTAVLNIDNETGRGYLAQLPPNLPRITYSASGNREADLTAINLRFSGTGTTGDLRLSERISGSAAVVKKHFRSPLLGSFNVANLLAAVGGALALDLTLDQISAEIPSIPQVPGRLETFSSADNVTGVVDYAHTDDAVIKALATLREVGKGRLLVVLGCGGNRDKKKRPLMAKAAVQGADIAVFTSDNPRNEDPEKILDDMEAGVADQPEFAGKWERIAERRQAIAHALAMARPGDIVCVAGKGHETTQEIMGQYHPFDDRLVVQEFLRRRVA